MLLCVLTVIQAHFILSFCLLLLISTFEKNLWSGIFFYFYFFPLGGEEGGRKRGKKNPTKSRERPAGNRNPIVVDPVKKLMLVFDILVFKKPLARFSQSPMTGFFRDGYCRVGPEDGGNHAVAGTLRLSRRSIKSSIRILSLSSFKRLPPPSSS